MKLNCEHTGLEYIYKKGSSSKSICILHGYGASMDDLAPLSGYLDPEENYSWYFLNAPIKVPIGFMMEGRAWFNIDMQALDEAMRTGNHRSFKEFKSPEFDNSFSKCKEFIEHHLEGKFVLGGFSQGAMLSTHLSLSLSEKISGLLCLSGTLIDQNGLVASLCACPAMLSNLTD